ncbi:DUF5313 family protein [Pseudonocardia humida]|uniref:DUF5313 family protein n=1 Tax=Pseudonocardia humida TaxID=2800819 RepID=A0ABT1A8F0_9PSEU|nr:DUF5313 family protein [Pseudonocardia humida]MCO1659304.1 DUF5313 family protein [Pseudonocardia humida]
MSTDTVRPDPFRWVLYAFGAGLPERNRAWVLHDVTTRTWFLRHLVRAVVQIVPVALLLYVLLNPVLGFSPTITLMAIVAGAAIGLFYGAAFAWGSTVHRAIKAGYSEATVEAARAEHRQRTG